jgi:hypothetical protein
VSDEIRLPDRIREASEVAARAVVLYSVVAVAFGAERAEIVDWLQVNGLEDALSPDERAFVETANPSERAIINFSWHSERLIVLLWALGLSEMPPADEQCDSAAAESSLPPDAEISVAEFLMASRLRPEAELEATMEEIYQLHWKARDAKLNARPSPPGVDLGIIQERHHAINWIMGYEGLDWDEVTTDT